MKKNQLSMHPSGFPGFLMALAIITTTLFVSCNGGDKKPKEPTPAAMAQPATAQAFGPFVVLKLSAADLKALFPAGGPGGGSAAQKLEIQFSNGSGYFITGVALNAKTNGDYAGVMKSLTAASTSGWDTTGTKILGNNEITQKQITTLLGGPIQSKAVDLYFYPKKDANNQIYFVVSKQLISAMTMKEGGTVTMDYPTDGFDTKPSPPAPPCNPCD